VRDSINIAPAQDVRCERPLRIDAQILLLKTPFGLRELGSQNAVDLRIRKTAFDPYESLGGLFNQSVLEFDRIDLECFCQGAGCDQRIGHTIRVDVQAL
jgi:hypothetical protein